MATLRLCHRKGWSLATFYALSEDEQLDWLAYDEFMQKQYDTMVEKLTKGEHKDAGAIVATILARLG